MGPESEDRSGNPVAAPTKPEGSVPYHEETRRSHNELTIGFTDVKNQHITPQFILRRFANSDDQVRAFDLDGERFFTTKIINIAARTKYYDTPLELDEKSIAEAIELGIDVEQLRISAEPWLTSVESDAAPLIERLVDDPQSIDQFDEADEHRLARFLAAQYFRAPAYRHSMDRTMEEMKAGIMRVFPEGTKVPASIEDVSTTASDVIDMLRETHGWANLLRSMHWRVGRIPEDSTLNTSDNMMSAKSKYACSYSHPRGLSGVDYWIALSPKTLLHLRPRHMDDSSGWGSRNRQDFDGWEANYANLVICANATQFVIGDGPVFSRKDCLKQLTRVDHARGRIALELGFDPGPKIIPPFWDEEIREMYGDLPPITGGLPLNQRPLPRYELEDMDQELDRTAN